MGDMDQLERLEGVEQMAYVAAHDDVAKKYNERAKKVVKKSAPVKASVSVSPQELDGVEDMAYIAAQSEEKNKTKSKPSVRKFISDLITKNKEDKSM